MIIIFSFPDGPSDRHPFEPETAIGIFKQRPPSIVLNSPVNEDDVTGFPDELNDSIFQRPRCLGIVRSSPTAKWKERRIFRAEDELYEDVYFTESNEKQQKKQPNCEQSDYIYEEMNAIVFHDDQSQSCEIARSPALSTERIVAHTGSPTQRKKPQPQVPEKPKSQKQYVAKIKIIGHR